MQQITFISNLTVPVSQWRVIQMFVQSYLSSQPSELFIVKWKDSQAQMLPSLKHWLVHSHVPRRLAEPTRSLQRRRVKHKQSFTQLSRTCYSPFLTYIIFPLTVWMFSKGWVLRGKDGLMNRNHCNRNCTSQKQLWFDYTLLTVGGQD